ncbi:MAG: bifunctional demethylmenaquinone methyltransferase/2-methoxy-6-polyprenyl-1,4-benzoquinol methylase UbiE [Kofleriaceae bacterium]|nr:bifunctional demethylmenaquinone methyltransferase/2-methoxy-6-polyprenyl-1,4-benzoquinol methylase UbiE [Kofleriaceae bacterium]
MTQVAPQNDSALTPPKLGSGQMFDRIANRYDRVNRVLSLGLDQRWRRRLVRELGLDGKVAAKTQWSGGKPRVLDVATGTGDLAIEIAKACPGASVIGLDPSANMLEIAKQKVEKRGMAERVSLVLGDAQNLPQQNCEIDAATIAFGIRNVPDRGRGLRELARVVRPGGRVAVLELGEPRRGVFGAAARFHSHVLVPRLGAWLSSAREYRYLQTSVAAFPPPEEFAKLMKESGLDVLDIIPLTFGVCNLYIGTPSEDA